MAREPINFTGTRVVSGGTLAQFRGIMNPQNWENNVPLLWQESGVIFQDRLPPDRAADPQTETMPGDWANRLFYEDVVFGFVSRQRNVLRTSYTETATWIDFRYSQFECLSSVFLGSENLGGVDIDEGGATCVEDNTGTLTLTITKRVRFSQPADELWLVDLFGPVFVKYVMELLLLGIL